MRAIYSGKKNIGSVVTVVPIKSIVQLLEASEWLKDMDCYILSNTDSLLIGGAEKAARSLSYEDFTENETLLTIPIGDEEYLGSCVDSTLGVWKYAVCTPKRVALQKQHALRTFIIFDFIVSILFGVFMSLTMSRRHYTPLQKITETLYNNAREYEGLDALPVVVDNVIASIKKENRQMEHELYKQDKMLRNQLLSRILLGEYGDEADVCRTLRELNPLLQDGPCVVVLFRPKEIENSIFAEPVSDGKESAKMISFDLMFASCENVISEMLFAEGRKGVVGHFDGRICCILQDDISADNKERFRKLLQEIEDFHREVLQLRLYAFATAPRASFSGLPDAYQRAMELKELKKFWGDELDDIVFESDMHSSGAMRIGGQTAVQKRLLNLLMVRDFAAARQLIQDELSRNFYKDANSLFHIRIYIMSLVDMVVDAIADGGTEKDEAFCRSLQPDRLYGAQSVQELKQETMRLLDQIVAYNDGKENGEQPCWIVKVRKFIEAHYADSMLDVSMIAQTFDLNVSYMSRTFKKYVGTGILEYIHQTRLQHGKEMLCRGASVRETAEKCGYIDSKALIRAFKRYEGVTPGQWSEMQDGRK